MQSQAAKLQDSILEETLELLEQILHGRFQLVDTKPPQGQEKTRHHLPVQADPQDHEMHQHVPTDK